MNSYPDFEQHIIHGNDNILYMVMSNYSKVEQICISPTTILLLEDSFAFN